MILDSLCLKVQAAERREYLDQWIREKSLNKNVLIVPLVIKLIIVSMRVAKLWFVV